MPHQLSHPSNLPSKLSFDDYLLSATIFYYDINVEKKFNEAIEKQAVKIRDANIGHGRPKVSDVREFILNQSDALQRITSILRIPQEKFLRIVALIRELDAPTDQAINDRLHSSEWNFKKIEKKVRENSGHNPFADRLIDVLLNGYQDTRLKDTLPQIYRERLQLKTLNEYTDEQNLIFNLKDRHHAWYNSMKGYAVEEKIKEQVQLAHQSFAQGNCAFVVRKVDLMIPDAINPKILIMSSYDETTSSAQSTRASDMIQIYQSLKHRQMQRGRKYYFINVVDGGGWIARRKDLKRMYDACDYCLSISELPQLSNIITSIMTQRL